MPTVRHPIILAFALVLQSAFWSAWAQVNSGSDGSDGAFNPTQNVTIDMTDHPDGIYQYTSVNIPSTVTVNFTPNPNNTPVVWLVQGDCQIEGVVSPGTAGGFAGGNTTPPSAGLGPGGGQVGASMGGNGSFATSGGVVTNAQSPAGLTYGNQFLIPLIGGSGGGAGGYYGGGGGGGAILIATSSTLTVDGAINANGGGSTNSNGGNGVGGGGSGGAIRLVATTIKGSGQISAGGGQSFLIFGDGGYYYSNAGAGWIRFDTYQNQFNGSLGAGTFTQGFQPIIIPSPGQGVQLAIASIGGTAVPTAPSGVLTNPDVIIPGQQNNPMSIVVNCTNLPLNTAITVVAHPANGTDVQAVGTNNVGTVASSTATVSINLPQGGGILYADCLSGTTATTSSTIHGKTPSYAKTGLTTDGERISAVEIIAKAGAPQQTFYRTPSGKRLTVANK